MMLWIANKIMPSNKRLAEKAARLAADKVNGDLAAKQAVIAHYATVGAELSELSSTLANILKDGHIDEMEQQTLAALVEPVIAKAREIVGV